VRNDLSRSLTKRLLAVVKKALAAFGLEGWGHGSGRSKMARWEPRVSLAECVSGGDLHRREPLCSHVLWKFKRSHLRCICPQDCFE
jgi:hypothetical protein